MTILELIKKLEENNRQQSINDEAIKSLRDEIIKREVRKNRLCEDNKELKRQQIKVEIGDVKKQLKKDWQVDDVFVKVEDIFVNRVREEGEYKSLSAEEICNLARGTYLVFIFRAGSKCARIIRPFNPDAIEKTGRKLSELVDVEIPGKYEKRAYYTISFKRNEVKNYVFEGSLGSFISGDGIVVVHAGLNRELEDEKDI